VQAGSVQCSSITHAEREEKEARRKCSACAESRREVRVKVKVYMRTAEKYFTISAIRAVISFSSDAFIG